MGLYGSLWNLVCIASQRLASWIPPIISCVSLLGNGSIKCYRSNKYTRNRNCWRRFLCGSCRMKGGFLFQNKESKVKIKIGIWDHAVHVSVNYSVPINFWMPEPICRKLGMYIVAPEPISTTFFINPSHRSVSVFIYFIFLRYGK
jgi:hypothetical protein